MSKPADTVSPRAKRYRYTASKTKILLSRPKVIDGEWCAAAFVVLDRRQKNRCVLECRTLIEARSERDRLNALDLPLAKKQIALD